MASAILFFIIGVIICAGVVVAALTTVDVYYLSGSRAIADDGLRRGSAAPVWSLPDSSGQVVCSPPRAKPLQMIVFSDHSLKSFPSVAEGLRSLAGQVPDLDIVVLTRHESSLARPLLDALELGRLPVVTGSAKLYGKYNVRVMPFVVVVDSAGQVRASSLVNHAWQVGKLWRLAQVDPGPGDPLAASRFGRWPRGVRA
jgi:hypothetical protein